MKDALIVLTIELIIIISILAFIVNLVVFLKNTSKFFKKFKRRRYAKRRMKKYYNKQGE
ncbi:MAG: hypothetical protein II309_02030 [Bacilli bacterium]|nr:hypothetical protein [Bacilli bacterium]